jgi:hypothetical protein
MNVLDLGFGSLEAQLWQIFFLSIRCGAALMAAPMVGGTAVPAPLRILLSLVLGFFVASWVPFAPAPAMLSLAAVLAVLHEVAIGVALGMVGLNIQTYQRLTYEQPVAEMSFRQQGPQLYGATMKLPRGRPSALPAGGWTSCGGN